MQDQGNKFVRVGLTMTTLAKVQMPFLVSTMLIINERNRVWMKEVHVIVFNPCGSQHLTRWLQKCHKLHHEYLCVHASGFQV